MEGAPRFRVVREGKYGPILERVSHDKREMIPNENGGFDFKESKPYELSEDQRSGLRKVLESIGAIFDSKEVDDKKDKIRGKEDKKVDLSKRRFLKAAAAAPVVVAAAAAGVSLNHKESGVSNDFDQSEDLQKRAQEAIYHQEKESESVEIVETFSSFENEVIKYQVPLLLKRDEIWFIDKEGLPIGKKVPLHELSDGQNVYSPGTFNEVGILKTGINKNWLQQVKWYHQARYPEQKIANHVDVIGQFAAAYNQDDEPGLSRAVASGEVEDFKGIIEYYAGKPVIGAEHMTRMEYVQEAIRFDDSIPTFAQDELRRVIPGLCAQESKFNNGLISKSGAEGIFQFMPKTWAAYGGSPEDFLSLERQVEIAGKFISDLYKRIQIHIGDEALQKLRSRYNNEESFQHDLLIPLVINSYNAGDSCVAEGVRLYLEMKERKGESLPSGKDLFVDIAEFSKLSEEGKFIPKYGKEAREYVTRIYAQAEALSA